LGHPFVALPALATRMLPSVIGGPGGCSGLEAIAGDNNVPAGQCERTSARAIGRAQKKKPLDGGSSHVERKSDMESNRTTLRVVSSRWRVRYRGNSAASDSPSTPKLAHVADQHQSGWLNKVVPLVSLEASH
jgi:hypothetical protein